MVSFAQVIIPILAAAVLVFIASSLIHTVIKYHDSEYRRLPNEDDVRAVVRAGGAGPAQYIIPHCTHEQMRSDAMKQKLIEGPVGVLVVRRSGPVSMGPILGSWFVLNLFVAAIAGYLACTTLPAGTSFLAVCRLVGGVTFLAYGVGSVSNAIWWGKPWSATIKELIDAFIYGLVSALAFAYLWPR
jgi:hypothetical protein